MLEKHYKFDKEFIARRNDWFAKTPLDPKEVVEHWPLFIGYVPLGVLLARYELLKMIQHVPGHILEFGCWNGRHLLFIAKVMQLLSPNDMRRIFGFDSFEGLQTFDPRDGEAQAHNFGGSYAGNLPMLRELIDLHGVEDRVDLVIGNVQDTLPTFLANNGHYPISYIYLDMDLYAPTKLVLEQCWPRLVPGGVIAFDEGYEERFPGEGVAMNEFLAARSAQCDVGHFHFARQPMLWLRKR